MNNYIKFQKQVEAQSLYKKGLSQKEIAEKLNVTEATLTAWFKPFKNEVKEYREIKKKLLKKLNTVLDDPKSTSTDIHNITNALGNISNKIETYFDTI